MTERINLYIGRKETKVYRIVLLVSVALFSVYHSRCSKAKKIIGSASAANFCQLRVRSVSSPRLEEQLIQLYREERKESGHALSRWVNERRTLTRWAVSLAALSGALRTTNKRDAMPCCGKIRITEKSMGVQRDSASR